MKKMKYTLAVILISGFTVNSIAQSNLTVEGSQNVTNFQFTNSSGEKVDGYEAQYSGGYAIGYSFGLKNGLYFPFKVGMRKAGATYVYDNSNYSWDLQYMETRLGIGYQYNFGKFGARFSAMGYYGYLLKANQRLNNENFNIRDNGTINKSDYGVFISPGAIFSATDNISIYLDLNYMLGLGNLETDSGQESHNSLYGATLGLAIKIK